METAWAAGFFEGEGCIHIKTGKSALFLIISSTDLDVLSRFKTWAKAGRIRLTKKQKPHHKDCWMWTCTAWPDVSRILAELLPWLGDRRSAKARLALTKKPSFVKSVIHGAES